jgi:molecular chaperone GrpE (heat shock protein)
MVIKVKKDTSGVAEAHHKKTGEQHAPTDKTIADVVELSKDEDRAEDLKAKLQDAERKSAENYDKYLRSIADLDNFRKQLGRLRGFQERAQAASGTASVLFAETRCGDH